MTNRKALYALFVLREKKDLDVGDIYKIVAQEGIHQGGYHALLGHIILTDEDIVLAENEDIYDVLEITIQGMK